MSQAFLLRKKVEVKEMKSCGIIVEYNPFHNGHAYHAEMARKKTGAEVVIAVMSGNFLQRGEPAILDKWQRAGQALQNGVDIVVELPPEWAVQPADYFARGGIKLLEALNCDALCFGTEGSEQFDYEAFGTWALENDSFIQQEYQKIGETGQSYPEKMTQIFQENWSGETIDFSSPNQILALSYAKENAKIKQPMKLFPLHRKNADYHDQEIRHEHIASATAIRKAVSEQRPFKETVPLQTYEDLLANPRQTWEDYWPFLRYQLLASEKNELTDIYQMSEGIETRLKQAAARAENFEAFLDQVKTKRYTRTRLQRLACYVLLNITSQHIQEQQEKTYLNILGFTKAGQRFLKEKKEAPILTRIGKKEANEANLLIKSDKLYAMPKKQIPEQNFGRIPLRYPKENEQ
ncbi:hypothetical protein D920_01244 [Enterococcus faecalis 13-SD-W-01]|nr:hypothetical protein D920_01244 [Enterococcus faecalis 13-SD-W-01]